MTMRGKTGDVGPNLRQDHLRGPGTDAGNGLQLEKSSLKRVQTICNLLVQPADCFVKVTDVIDIFMLAFRPR